MCGRLAKTLRKRHARVHALAKSISLSLLQTQAALFGPIVTFKARADDWNVRDPFLLLPGFHLSYFSLHDDTVPERRDLNVAIGNWKAVNLLVLVGAAVTPPVTFASLTKPVKNSEFFCKISKAKFWVLIFVDLLNIVAECFRSLVRLRINANFLLKHKWQTADW